MSKFSRQSPNQSTMVRPLKGPLESQVSSTPDVSVNTNPVPPILFSPLRFHKPGKFVSESKFLSDPAAFVPHIRAPNRDALDALITKPEVERRLLQRLRKKATVYAQDLAADGSPNQDGMGKIDVDGVVELYEHYIIPLTKEVEVRFCSSGSFPHS